MLKLLSALALTAFATVSFAASHGGAMKAPMTMEEQLAACKKLDPKTADPKKLEECKKLTEAKK